MISSLSKRPNNRPQTFQIYWTEQITSGLVERATTDGQWGATRSQRLPRYRMKY